MGSGTPDQLAPGWHRSFPPGVAAEHERSDGCTEQARDGDDHDQGRLAVEHPEVDAHVTQVGNGEPHQEDGGRQDAVHPHLVPVIDVRAPSLARPPAGSWVRVHRRPSHRAIVPQTAPLREQGVCHSADVVSRRVRRRRRQFAVGGVIVLLLLIYLVAFSGGSGPPPHESGTTVPSTATTRSTARSPLNPAWRGDGQAVTLGFGGDVHFEGAVAQNLATNPATALGDSIPQLMAGTQLSMVNLESVVTDGVCPEPQDKQYIFDAPPSAVTALKSARISLVTEGNDHGMDCGPQGLSQNLTIASTNNYPVIGIGANAEQAFAPFRVTLDGQRIAVIAATQVIPDNLIGTWTASSTQPGVASAIDPTMLVREVQQVRRTADTVIVYVHWGTETQTCPNPQQEPLARQLVQAGADVVVGSNAHVLLGGGYLGSAYVDYGLGNLAFYDSAGPEIDSGTLVVTAQGRHIESIAWRPATIASGVPEPLSGAAAATALKSWNAAHDCTDLTASPTRTLASTHSETTPFVAPATTTTTTTATSPSGNGSSGSSTTTTSSGSSTTTTSSSSAGGGTGGTTTTTSAATTTAPTDNAG